jgi:hypothetical protein
MCSATRSVFAALAALALAACATPYQPYSTWSDGGFTDREVLPGVFLVRFVGNEVTAPDRTADFALLRAAEICLQRGQGFMRFGGLETERAQSGYVAGTASAIAIPTGDPNAPPTVVVNSTPPTLLYAPQSGLAVSCADTPEEGTSDANYLARTIRARYSIS